MTFFASTILTGASFLAAIVPGVSLPGGHSDKPQFPAPPGYLLPWAGGAIHIVAQGEETGFTHNGIAAYAYDFDLAYETVVAARGGRVVMVRSDSNTGGCSRRFAASANYIVIDHGDGTSGLYLHLSHNSALVKSGDLVVQGDPIATSGETGVTCADDRKRAGPHLHFQVERTEPGHYLSQALPVAFDDFVSDGGVPEEGRSYVSANYGRDAREKIKLIPHHVWRVFNPRAIPLDANFLEAEPSADNNAASDPNLIANLRAAATAFAAPTDTPTPDPYAISFGIDTSGETPLPTATPTPTETPTPTATPTIAPPPPPPPAASATPVPTLVPPTVTVTPTPVPTDTSVPVTGSDTPVPVPSP